MAEKTSDNVSPQARALYQKGMAALERNNLDYAIEMFIQTLTTEPNFLTCRKYLRGAQMKRAESMGSFKRAVIATTSQMNLTKGQLALSKNPLEAMVIAEQVLSNDPKNVQALTLLANASEKANLPETTTQTLEHLIKVSPRDTRAMHLLARTFKAQNKHSLALAIYDRILQIDPADFDAQRGMKDASAAGAMAEGKWEEATSYRDVLKDKNESEVLEQQSRVVRAEEMIDSLIKGAHAKLDKDPDNPLIRRELGKLYGQKGDHATALKFLEQLFKAEGGADPSLEKEIAEIKYRLIDTKVEQQKQLLAANPKDAAIRQEIDALEIEKVKLQVSETRRLIERYPNDLLYRFDFGVLLMRAGDLDDAIVQFQKSAGQPQKRCASLFYQGQCFAQLGMHDLAIDQFNQAIADSPMMDGLKKDMIYGLASSYEAMGDQDKAINEYKKIAAVDFGFRDVKAKLTRKPTQKPPEPTS